MAKKIALPVFFFLLLTSAAFAQGLGGTFAIGARGGNTYYAGDDFEAPLLHAFGGGFFEYYLSNRFSIEPSFHIGEIAARTGDRRFRTLAYGGGLVLRFGLFGGELFRPYLAAGGRLSRYDIKNLPLTHTLPAGDDGKGTFFSVPLGGGISIRLGEGVTMDFRGTYALTFDDNKYDATAVDSRNDHYFTGTAGLTLTFRRKKDIDNDGLFTSDEKKFGTDPHKADTDDDGLLDGKEVLLYKTNPFSDDTDNDGLLDGDELEKYHTDPKNADSDVDGLSDGQEVQIGTDPTKYDTDDDGIEDGDEIKVYKTDPKLADSDGDGLNDGDEVKKFKTNALKKDSDGDGLSDFAEASQFGTNPLLADSDSDGLSDGEELNRYRTNPFKPDTDGGSIDDAAEVKRGSNPLVASDDVPSLSVQPGRGIVLDGVTFRTGSAELTPESLNVLDRAYFALRENPDIHVEIRGYTDNTGNIIVNMRLSQLRAEAVRDYLVRKGIDRKRVRPLGFGHHNPIASNATPEGRAKNRRIEFVVKK